MSVHINDILETKNMEFRTERYVIYQTQGRVFHQEIQTLRSGLKNEVQPSFFNPLRGVWIADETFFRV